VHLEISATDWSLISISKHHLDIDDYIQTTKHEGGTMTEKKESHSNYKGFVAGVFSGIAKLSGMPKPHSSKSSPHPLG
jgi:hypothetical protein